jgi:transcriptional regulator with XRE-family HTH domain
MRKRLGISQEDLGELVEKRGQTVAKWEKGELPVPSSDATVVKLVWLGEHAPRELRAFAARAASGTRADAFDYVFSRSTGRWAQDYVRGRILASQRARIEAHQAISNAVTSARVAPVPITVVALRSAATIDVSIHSSIHTTT